MADVGVFVAKVACWEVVGEDGHKRHSGDLKPLLDVSRTHQLPDRLLQLPKRVGEAYWIRHPHSPFGLAVTSGTTGSLEVYSTCVSWEFIGGSLPTASVEGARRPLQTACTTA